MTEKLHFACPITEDAIGVCEKQACMWYGQYAPYKCIAHTGIPDPQELSESYIAQCKGLTIEEVRSKKNRGTRAIERLLIVNRLVDWLDKQSIEYYKWSCAYQDENLISWYRNFQPSVYPFRVPSIRWSIGKPLMVMLTRTWRDFYREHPSVRREPHLRILGMSSVFAKGVVGQYKEAYKRMCSC
jgi:hypothetical protein